MRILIKYTYIYIYNVCIYVYSNTIYMAFFLLFVLINPVPGILRTSTLIRYRFVFGCVFRKCISPEGRAKELPKMDCVGCVVGGRRGFRV